MIANLKISAIVVLCVGCFVVLPYVYRQNQKNKTRVDDLVAYTRIQNDSAVVYQNRYNALVYQYDVARMDQQTMAKIREELAGITGRFNNLKDKLNNVESLSKTTLSAVSEMRGTMVDTVIVRDSVPTDAWRFNVGDSLYSVSGVVIPSTKEITVTPALRAEIYQVVYWRRKKFLFLRIGKKELKTEITSNNPYVTISGHKVITKRIN